MIFVTLFYKKLQKELSLNRIDGPFERHPFQFFAGLFKKDVVFFRITDDLSHPKENAVNLHKNMNLLIMLEHWYRGLVKVLLWQKRLWM